MKLKEKYLLASCLFAWLSPLALGSQTVRVHFPWLAGRTCEFTLFQGGKREVVQSDTIPADGRLILRVPEKYRGYCGMATWYITNSPKGGGLEFVVNGEDFSVECLDSVPSGKTIVYTGTREVPAMESLYREQQGLMSRYSAMGMALTCYGKGEPSYAVFRKEMDRAVAGFSAFSRSLDASPLYAAKMRKITNVTMGIADTLVEDEAGRAKAVSRYVSDGMDWGALYTSGHWEAVIDAWCQIQLNVVMDNAATLKSLRTILGRIPTDELYTDFLEKATFRLLRAGKDSIVDAVSGEVLDSRRLLRHNGVLVSYGGLARGDRAPSLDTGQGGLLKSDGLGGRYTLLAFYQSGCGPCEGTMEMLKSNYASLKSKGVRLVSISGDVDRQVFANTSSGFPWPDKYCDGKGVSDGNFRSFSVVGTPTLYLLDSGGRVLAKMADVNALLEKMRELEEGSRGK